MTVLLTKYVNRIIHVSMYGHHRIMGLMVFPWGFSDKPINFSSGL